MDEETYTTGKTEKKAHIPLNLAVIVKFLDEIGFEEMVNDAVAGENACYWKVSPGKLLTAFLLTTFMDVRPVLTKVGESFRRHGIDLASLLGIDIEYSDVNAYNIGRALAALGAAEGKVEELYGKAVKRLAEAGLIPMGTRIHADTTSISFWGDFLVNLDTLTAEERERMLVLAFGHNKDGRPDGKQLVLGLFVNEHGIPVFVRIMDGNTQDTTWNGDAIDLIHGIMGEWDGGVYVADCKLATKKNIAKLYGQEVRFVTMCPECFCRKAREKAINTVLASGKPMTDLGQLSGDREKGATYSSMSIVESDIHGQPARLQVVHSSELEKKALKKVDKAREAEVKAMAAMGKKRLKDPQAAKRIVGDYDKSHVNALFRCSPTIVEHAREKYRRGPRTRDAVPKIELTYTIDPGELVECREAIDRFVKLESHFVLLSNIMPEGEGNGGFAGEMGDLELLKTYKGQQVVENTFRILKQPQMASPIYLKNPDRIRALCIILVLSLLLRACVQHRLREGLARFREGHPGETIRAGWGNKVLGNPTFALWHWHVADCRIYRIGLDKPDVCFENGSEKRVRQLLGLLGIGLNELVA